MPQTTRLLLAAASTVVILAGIRAASFVVAPMLLAGFLAILLMPVVHALGRWGIRSGVALLVILFGIALVLFLLGSVVTYSLAEFTDSLPEFRQKVGEEWSAMRGWVESLGGESAVRTIDSEFDPQQGVDFFLLLIEPLRHSAGYAFLLAIILIFMLLEAAGFPLKIAAMLERRPELTGRVLSIARDIRRYMHIKTLTSLITGVAIGIWLWVLGVDFWLVWGFLAFVLNFIPNIGSLVASVPGVALALIQLGPMGALLAAAGYLGANVTVGNFIEPRWMGRELGLSPLVIILSLVLWGWVLGVVGMFLAVPIVMSIKIIADSSRETRWLGTLLGPAHARPAMYATEGNAEELVDEDALAREDAENHSTSAPHAGTGAEEDAHEPR